jgi:methionyl-tRNA formyltransferase
MNKNMRIVFFGTPAFAVNALDILVKNNYSIVGVVTAPDKPAGRGQKIQQSAVKEYAVHHDLNTMQPEKLKDSDFIDTLKSLNADLHIVVAFRMLPESIWGMPRLGTFNLHASLLPQYRGAAPINWAIMNGEKETGVTTFFLKQEIDTGKIIFNDVTNIGENETAGELHDRLMTMGASLVLKTVRAIEEGDYPQKPQQENSSLQHAPKIFKEDGRINWKKNLYEIHNFIRGLSPYPTAWTELKAPDGHLYVLKIFRAEKEANSEVTPSSILENDGKQILKIAVKGGYIVIKELQLAGKKRMTAEEYLRGYKLAGEWHLI